MATFLMLGRYSAEGRRGITAGRTQKAKEAIRELGGEVQSIHALLGEHDLAIVVELPDLDRALLGALALARLTGVTFSTYPAFSAEHFDQLMNTPG
jgi:uncharacterized protein with GYD domain